MSRLVYFIALVILLNAAPAFSQCAIAAIDAPAPTTSGFVVGSTAALSYAFKGQTAPKHGIVCKGCAKYEAGATSGTAGTWFTVSDAAKGDTKPTGVTGFFCPSDKTACSPITAPTSTATSAGKLYKKQTVAKGVTATSTGVLCPGEDQTGNPSNTCQAAKKDAKANFLGTACDGTTFACTAVIKGYLAPTNGVNCEGCVYKNKGETANAAGRFWTYAGELASEEINPSANPSLFCPSDRGTCSEIPVDGAAPSAGRYASWTAVAAGAVAPKAGVLCPTIPGWCSADGLSCATTKDALLSSGMALLPAVKQGIPPVNGAAATATPIVITGQGTAIGYTANSAHKSTFSMLALIAPMLAVVKMVFCN